MSAKDRLLCAWFGSVKENEILVETETGKRFKVLGQGSTSAHLKVMGENKQVYDFHNCFLHPDGEEAP